MADQEPVAGALTPQEGGGSSPGGKIAQFALTLIIVYLVFFQVLPSVADWSEVGDALSAVSWWQFALVILFSLGIECIKAVEQWLIIPILRFIRSFVALETATMVGNIVPASTTATRFALYRSWGITTSEFARGWLVASALNNLIVLLAPVLGIAFLLVNGAGTPGWLIFAAVVAAILAGVAVVIVVLALRSHSFTLRVGALLARIVRWLRGVLKRPSDEDVQAAVVRFREDAVEVLHHRGLLLCLVILGKYVLTSALLWLSLEILGVPESVVSYGEVFAVYTFVRLLTIVTITPGSIGIADALYSAGLLAVAGSSSDEYESQIIAAVVVFRAATYALPIVLGACCYIVWRLKKSWRAPLPDAPRTFDETIQHP